MSWPKLVYQNTNQYPGGNGHGYIENHQCLNLLSGEVKSLLDYRQHWGMAKPDDKTEKKGEPRNMQHPDFRIFEVQ